MSRGGVGHRLPANVADHRAVPGPDRRGARGHGGEDSILVEGSTVRLNPQLISTDCQAFAELLEEDRLEEAVATYAGPFLDGFHLRSSHAFEEWRDREARHLGRRYEEALEELARRAEGVGDLRKAAGYWERLSEQDPLNTRHISDWMKALASVGDPGNAIRVGEDHIALLRAELEADPPGQLVALLRTLKSGRSTR